MREGTISSYKVYYPDSVCFCFNPNKIIVETDREVTFLIGNKGALQNYGTFDSTFDRTFRVVKGAFVDDRDSNKTKVVLDVSPYLQALFDFDPVGEMISSKEIDVKIEISGANMQFSVVTIWSSLAIGESITDARKVRKFGDLPFTISYFDTSMHHSDLSSKPSYISVEEVECGDGVYLRWIDRHGFYQYWLFSKGQDDIKSNQYGEQLYQDYEVGGRGYYGVSRMQGMEVANTMRICASLVDRDYYSMVRTIIGSPMVDMYQDGVWIPVRINNSTVSDEGKSLQDIEFSIVLPDIITQKL